MYLNEIVPLFAKPLVKFSLETEHEKWTEILEERCNEENYLAMEDNYFIKDLNKDPVFDKLQDDIMHCVRYMVNDVYEFKDIEPYMVTMWGVGVKPTSYVRTHYHSNSFISGVYYPGDMDYAPLRFYDTINSTIRPNIKKVNILNVPNSIQKPMGGDLFLFPSQLKHDTLPNNTDGIRLSISFNVWIKGIVGDETSLTYLEL